MCTVILRTTENTHPSVPFPVFTSLPHPINGVEIIIGTNARDGFIQKVQQVGGTADAAPVCHGVMSSYKAEGDHERALWGTVVNYAASSAVHWGLVKKQLPLEIITLKQRKESIRKIHQKLGNRQKDYGMSFPTHTLSPKSASSSSWFPH